MNYKMTADYHTHTIISDGESTLQENVQAALCAGLKTLAVSDHGPKHIGYGIRNMDQYIAIFIKEKEKTPNLSLLLGIELNLTSLKGDIDLEETYKNVFDIKIMGYHKLVKPQDFTTMVHFYAKRLSKKASVIHQTTDAYIEALSRHRIDILAHPDYAIAVDIPAVAAACAEYDVLFELNNRHKQLNEKMIESAAKQGCHFVLSSDAHTDREIGHAPVALQKALNVGLTDREIVNLMAVQT